MAGEAERRRHFYHRISRLKSLDRAGDSTRFTVEQSPFSNDDTDSGEYRVVGLIYLKSGPKRVEIQWKENYPDQLPEIKFLQPISHPIVKNNGEICPDLLRKILDYSSETTLVDIVKKIAKYFDETSGLASSTGNIGFIEHRAEIVRPAVDAMKKRALSQRKIP